MKALKEFMRKNAFKLVYVCMGLPVIVGDIPSLLFFGELPFPTEEYMRIINSQNERRDVIK